MACNVHVLCAEVWKKNVEVKSNVFRFLTFLYVSHYVKEYTIDMDMDMDSPSECGPGRRRRAEKSQTRSTKANAFFLSNSIGLGLMMLHAHHSLPWGRAKPSEQKTDCEKEIHKKCAAYGLRCRRRKKNLLVIYVLLKYCRWRWCSLLLLLMWLMQHHGYCTKNWIFSTDSEYDIAIINT